MNRYGIVMLALALNACGGAARSFPDPSPGDALDAAPGALTTDDAGSTADLPDAAPLVDVGATSPEAAASDAGAPSGDAGHPVEASAPDTGVGVAVDSGPPDSGAACVPHCPSKVTCGVADDGCGGKMQCGTCSGHESCGGGGVAGQCGCTPLACTAGQTCGSVPDNCGGTVQCGDCGADSLCNGGSCVAMSTFGCTALPGCASTVSPPAGENCVTLFSYFPNSEIGTRWACPASVSLPAPSCVTVNNSSDCASGDPAQ